MAKKRPTTKAATQRASAEKRRHQNERSGNTKKSKKRPDWTRLNNEKK